jgi:hypothetical protein
MAQAAKREHYSVHFIFSLELGCTLTLDSTLKTWLVARADTHPDVSTYEMGGPVYSYEPTRPTKEKKTLTTTVPMTVYDAQERRGYWDVLDDRGKRASRQFDIKREHAALEGVGYQVFTTSYFEETIVERKNTITAHRWLYSAHGVDTSTVESGMRLKTAQRAMTFQQLADELRCNVMESRVAALRLWKQSRLRLPADKLLLCHPDFTVQGLYS